MEGLEKTQKSKEEIKREVIERIRKIIETELKGKPFNYGVILHYYLKNEFESQVTEEELADYCKETLADLAEKEIICGVSGGELPTGAFIYVEKANKEPDHKQGVDR